MRQMEAFGYGISGSYWCPSKGRASPRRTHYMDAQNLSSVLPAAAQTLRPSDLCFAAIRVFSSSASFQYSVVQLRCIAQHPPSTDRVSLRLVCTRHRQGAPVDELGHALALLLCQCLAVGLHAFWNRASRKVSKVIHSSSARRRHTGASLSQQSLTSVWRATPNLGCSHGRDQSRGGESRLHSWPSADPPSPRM